MTQLQNSSFVILIRHFPCPTTPAKKPWNRPRIAGSRPAQGHVAKSHDLGSAGLLLAAGGADDAGGGLVGFLVEYCRSNWAASLAGGRRGLRRQPMARHALGVGPLPAADPRTALPGRRGGQRASNRLSVPAGAVGLRPYPARSAARAAAHFLGASMVRLGFGIVKLVIVLGVACVVLYGQREAILGLSNLAPAAIAVQMAQILFWTALKIGAALLVLAILDYAYQRWRHEQDLKMTPQELREEMRNLEGNPQVIARRKQVQRELVLRTGCRRLCRRPTWSSPTQPSWPWPFATIRRPCRRRSWWPRVPAPPAKQIRQLALETAFRSSRRSHCPDALPRVDINHPIPPTSTRPWPKCWRTCINSRKKVPQSRLNDAGDDESADVRAVIHASHVLRLLPLAPSPPRSPLFLA